MDKSIKITEEVHQELLKKRSMYKSIDHILRELLGMDITATQHERAERHDKINAIEHRGVAKKERTYSTPGYGYAALEVDETLELDLIPMTPDYLRMGRSLGAYMRKTGKRFEYILGKKSTQIKRIK